MAKKQIKQNGQKSASYIILMETMLALKKSNIYVAICEDHHVDVYVQIFLNKEEAIKHAKEFIPEKYEINEQELTKRMKQNDWIYSAIYGVEGDNVRVEKQKIR